MGWSQSVFSTMVKEVAYDSDAQELRVTWNSGRTSAYSDVPEDIAHQVANAPSVGQAINQMIKDQYGHRYV
jgi:hypothetical protein